MLSICLNCHKVSHVLCKKQIDNQYHLTRTLSLSHTPSTLIFNVVLPFFSPFTLIFAAVFFETIFAFFVFLYVFFDPDFLPMIFTVFVLPFFTVMPVLLSLGVPAWGIFI